MRRQFSTAATIAALLGVYLGVPCVALARAHAAMGEAPAAPCEAGQTPAAQLLCVAPEAYTPLAAASPDLAVANAQAGPELAATDLGKALTAIDRDPAPPGAPPAFLLHRALLI